MKGRGIKILTLTVAVIFVLTGAVLMAQQENMTLNSSDVFKKKERPAAIFPHGKHIEAGLECTDCHHVVDQGQLEEGNPDIRCSACHASDLQQAFHDQCIGCHIKLQKEKKKTGPRYCGECHIRK
jgi:formate-dependent nitrite reductase cytochrome c552 subunit